MGFLEALKQIIKIDLSSAKILSPTIIVKKEGDSRKTIVDNGVPKVNLLALDSEEKEKVMRALLTGFERKDILNIIEKKAEDRVIDIKRKASATELTLSYYKDKISDRHYKILEASLYLREVYRQGSDIKDLKRDIMRKYGEDGKIISNLCSANYFEGYLKQAYEEMSQSPTFTPEEYQQYFQTIITTQPFAIFVHTEMEEDELEGLIQRKIQTHQNYGIKFLAIHGIGYQNVKKILKIVSEMEDRDSYKTGIAQQGNVITVTIYFP